MKSPKAASAIWTRQRAQVMVLIALLAALGLGWYESKEISAADISLTNLPRKVGSWQTVSEQTSLSSDNAYKLLKRTYQNDEGQELYLTVQATYTRLGSLRDWSLASMAEGWSIKEQSVWKSKVAHGLPIEARTQRLAKGTRQRVALTWYTSAQSQAPTLQLAELKAWRDRLAGGKKPWASMYLLTELDSGSEEAVEQLAEQLAPVVRQAICSMDAQ